MSAASCLSVPMPYLPMVNAIAPNAPMGASFMMKPTTRKSPCETFSMKLTTGRPSSPAEASASPKSSEKSSTCRISPFANASTMVEGITFMRKSTVPWDFAAVV